MIEKVLNYISRYRMLAGDEHVVAGVSGGADSVGMLCILLEIQKSIPFTLEVVHIEHGIRGKESLADQEFVKDLCRKKGISCTCYSYPVQEIAKQRRLTVEEAGRMVRYETFQKHADRYPDSRIAVAHNQNDRAETVLFNLSRGTGLRGISGISPVRGQIIRPILCLSRVEIEQYLRENSQDYCTDATNNSLDYTRNRIRHLVLPELQNINIQAVGHIAQAAERTEEVWNYLHRQAQEIAEKAQVQEDGIEIGKEQLQALPNILKQEVVHILLIKAAKSQKDIGSLHILQTIELLERPEGRQIDLVYGLSAQIRRNTLRIWKKECREVEKMSIITKNAIVPGEVLLDGARMRFRLLDLTDKNYEIPQKAYTKWFDYDKIKGNLQVRSRQQGDYLVIDADGRHQSLKKYFVNEKIPQYERDQVPLLAVGHEVIWVVGHRISECCKVTDHTKEILEVQFIMEEQET